ncbi:hypothetical protein, partial [Mesobacillus sp.]|uniref:hypothetical protein n=1 Tax=Mesobacillus sp. TaxID=2675271 RepID=UPI0039EF3CED
TAARRLSAGPAESEAPGTEINSPNFTTNQKKTVNKHDFHRVCLQSETLPSGSFVFDYFSFCKL